MLKIENLSVRFDNLTILENINLELSDNTWLMVVGPNGAGKSTLIQAVSQNIPYRGNVFYNDTDLKKLKPIENAKILGVVNQHNHVGYSFSVEEIVRLGRYSSSKKIFRTVTDEDEEKIKDSLLKTGMYEKRNQAVPTLSGGEIQRTFLAQVLTQDPNILLLDEPTNHLDLVYQKQVFELITKWLKKKNRAVISVVHDLSLAKAYGSHAILLDKGHQRASGLLKDVMTDKNLNEVYEMKVSDWMTGLLKNW